MEKLKMKFGYRKFGDFYYVSELHSYNNVTKEYQSTSIGTVRRHGKEWFGKANNGKTVKANTRGKASIAMVEEMEKGR
jgi:hypothetical protein